MEAAKGRTGATVAEKFFTNLRPPARAEHCLTSSSHFFLALEVCARIILFIDITVVCVLASFHITHRDQLYPVIYAVAHPVSILSGRKENDHKHTRQGSQARFENHQRSAYVEVGMES